MKLSRRVLWRVSHLAIAACACSSPSHDAGAGQAGAPAVGSGGVAGAAPVPPGEPAALQMPRGGGALGTGGTAAVAMPDAGGRDVTASDGAFYVSPTGNDTGAGTLAQPLRTLAKARDLVRGINANMVADLHVYLRGGTYDVAETIAFGPRDSGTNGHRIFYEAYPGETPVLNGATKVTGWTPSGNNVYKAQLDRKIKLRNLYVNHARASMTRKTVTAQGGYGTYSVTAGQASWAWAAGSNSDGAKYNTADIPNIANNKDDLEIVNATSRSTTQTRSASRAT